MKKSGLSLVFSLFVLLGINGQAAAQARRYTVQLEATPELEIALEKVKGFRGQGLDAYIVKIDVEGKGTFYRIRVGIFPTQADARKYAADLQRLGFSSDFFIARYEPPQGDLAEVATTRGAAAPAAGTPPASAPPAKTQPVKDQPKDVKQPSPPANTPAAAPATAPPASTQPAKELVEQPAAVANVPPATALPASTPPAKEPVEQPAAVANVPPATAPPASAPPVKEEVKQPAPPANTALAAKISTPTTNPVTAKEEVKQPAPPANTALAAKISTPTTNPVTAPAGAAPAPITPAAGAPAINFVKFQDQAIGYSFDRPQTWEGGQLDSKDAKDQNVSAGAVFKSYQETAFIASVWSSLEKANSPEQDNDLIIQLVLQSMGSDAGTQQMTETGRRVVSENGVIKTYLDLKASFKSEGQEGPLDFLGKGVIARTNKGILFVVAFYWKGGPPYVSGIADQIIASVRAPL
jgi:SPOR domain